MSSTTPYGSRMMYEEAGASVSGVGTCSGCIHERSSDALRCTSVATRNTSDAAASYSGLCRSDCSAATKAASFSDNIAYRRSSCCLRHSYVLVT